MKKILVSFLIGCILANAMPSIAQSIEVEFNKIKVMVNGTPVQADNVLINGRTYVPLRAIGEILGKDIAWDEKTSIAGVNDKDYEEKKASPGYSRNNPAEIGKTLKCDFDSGYDSTFKKMTSSANITVDEIIRGDKALEMIKEANSFNKNPDSGFDYIVAKIEFELL